jgi:lipocalin
MVLRPDSKDELKRNKIWIAVRILPMKMKSKFEIYGWAWGHEVMQNKDDTCKWFRLGDPSRPKAWWYPRSMLHSMDDLPSVEETLRLMQQREAAE